MGTMVRERVAANIMLGGFWAESLIMAEAASDIGAIQIAGTARLTQIPFFVVACDYVLIGEELFAASAIASGNPIKLGSIAGQDIGKLIAVALILVGSILESAGIGFLSQIVSK
jgi:Na+-translocating ferredoxin:NAD+ oxidoreductase RnfE subunit